MKAALFIALLSISLPSFAKTIIDCKGKYPIPKACPGPCGPGIGTCYEGIIKELGEGKCEWGCVRGELPDSELIEVKNMPFSKLEEIVQNDCPRSLVEHSPSDLGSRTKCEYIKRLQEYMSQNGCKKSSSNGDKSPASGKGI